MVTGTAQPFFRRHTQPAGQTVNPGVLIWELKSREKPRLIRVPSLPTVQAFSPDGLLLALGFLDSSVQLWNTKTGEKLFRWTAFEQPTKLHLAFTPDGKALAASSSDSGSIQLLDLTSLRRQLAAIGLDW